MSLINDALRKAHLEAGGNEGTPPALWLPPEESHTGRPPAGRLRRLAAAAILLAAGALVGGLVLPRASSSPTARPPATELSAAAPAAQGPAPAAPRAGAGSDAQPELRQDLQPDVQPNVRTAVQAGVQADVQAGVQADVQADAQPKVQTDPGPDAVAGSEATPASRAPAVTRAPSPAPASPPPRRPRHGLVPGKTYKERVPLPGGRDLHLNGISSIGERHLAFLDGKLVNAGDQVGSFTIVRIDRDRVELRVGDVTIFLSL